MTDKTEVKVFAYNENADTLNCTVNGAKKEIPADDFREAFDKHVENVSDRMSGNKIELTSEEYCLAMIFDMHFDEEPTDLCWTFYEVNL